MGLAKKQHNPLFVARAVQLQQATSTATLRGRTTMVSLAAPILLSTSFQSQTFADPFLAHTRALQQHELGRLRSDEPA